jgi:hypothetical protein
MTSALICAGRVVPDFEDRVRRYCGLWWSGGPPETWAYGYYDLLPSARLDDRIGRYDVLACAALHPGLSRDDLAFFAEQPDVINRWLHALPKDVDLADTNEQTMNHLATLSELVGATSLALLSKVAHRKRPRLVPLFDRAIADWYRPVTGERGVAAWPGLIEALRSDLRQPGNTKALSRFRVALDNELGAATPSDVRIVDIAIWMGAIS